MPNLALCLSLSAAAASSGSPQDQLWRMLLPLILIMGAFYFIMIRPQKREQSERQKQIDELQVRDKVITIGGIHGTVKDVKEKTVKVEVAPKVVIEMNRSAVLNVESKNKAKTGADDADDKKG